jgi:hypothetical protein
MKNFSDYIISLRGKVSIPNEIDDTKSYKILLDGEFPSTKEHNLENGEYAKEYIFKPIMGQIIGENGEVTKIKDIRKRSQQLRAVLRREWQEDGNGLTEEEYYEREMAIIISERINNR